MKSEVLIFEAAGPVICVSVLEKSWPRVLWHPR